MPELSRIRFLAGAAPFLILGTAHAWRTPRRPDEKKGLSPRDPSVADAMAHTTPRLTDRTDLWRAWVGFNFSHSLGAVLLGLFVVLIGRNDASSAGQVTFAAPLALAVSLGYLVLGIKYWFRTPIIGIGVSVACFATAWILQ